MQFQNGVYQPYNPYAAYGTQPMQYPQYAPQAPVQPSPLAQAAQQTAQPQAQQPAQPQQATPTQPVFVNKVLVTGKADAEMRQVPFNSEAIYIHQSKPFGFQVYTDPQGRKETTIFRLIPCEEKELEDETTAVAKADLSGYATKDDLNAGLADLETKIVQHMKQELKKIRAFVAEDGVDE